VSHHRADLDERLRAFERDLALMSDPALRRLTDAPRAWERGDEPLAARVVREDEAMDDLCLGVEERVLRTQILQAPVARDQRLLHVARIVCVAFERVGDLVAATSACSREAPDDPWPAETVLLGRHLERPPTTRRRSPCACASSTAARARPRTCGGEERAARG
jgi:phosphate transport system protein